MNTSSEEAVRGGKSTSSSLVTIGMIIFDLGMMARGNIVVDAFDIAMSVEAIEIAPEGRKSI